jgi:lactate permease
LAAVLIPSIGHGWAVTFGSLGTSFQALMASTNLPAETLGPPAAFMLGMACVATGPMITHAADGWATVKRLLASTLILGMLMGLVQYLAVSAGLWNLGAFTASIFGLLAGIPLALRTRKHHNNDGRLEIRPLLIALTGYAILVAVILVVQLIPSVKDFLSPVQFSLSIPEVSTALGYTTPAGETRKIVLFSHAGTLLLYSSILAYLVYHSAGLFKSGSVRRILDGTLRRVMSSSVSILSMVTMSVIMEYAGMTDSMARSLAEGMGVLFPLIAPWIGALGAFMTGSNTNSNVVFGALQKQTAELLGYAVPVILAAQTAGAALGSVAAPTKVVVGASTAGMAGKEGEVLRKLLGYIAILITLISILSLVGVLIYE